MSPTPSTITTTQRPLKFPPRSHPATRGPRTCVTWRSMTTPSAERSLQHCSLRSEKIQRAVSVMKEQGREELKRFQGSTFDSISRRKLIEDRDTILDLTSKIQELQDEKNCMSDSRDFKDAESVRSGLSYVTSQPVLFPPRPDPGGMLSRSLGLPSRKNGPPSIRDTHGISVFFSNPTASSSAPYPQEPNPRITQCIHQLRIRDASQDRQPEIQSSLVREFFFFF